MRPNLIVGGAGFIGTALIRRMGADNVHVFDSFSPLVHRTETMAGVLRSGAAVTVGSVDRAEDWDGLFAQGTPPVIFYLAAETGTGRSLKNCALNARINALGIAQMLDALTRAGRLPQRIVLTSTRAVYGEGPYRARGSDQAVYPEQRISAALEAGRFEFEGLLPVAASAAAHVANPVNIYGATKLAQEQLLQCWARAHGVAHVTLRLQNVYGAGQSVSNPYTGVLIHFIRAALARRPVEIFENGGITRDFVHVDDVARLLASAGEDRAPRSGTYDCGSGRRVELEDVARRIGRVVEFSDIRRSPAFRPGDVRHACADIAAAGRDFGWRPEVEMDAALADLVAFVRAEAA